MKTTTSEPLGWTIENPDRRRHLLVAVGNALSTAACGTAQTGGSITRGSNAGGGSAHICSRCAATAKRIGYPTPPEA